MAAPVHLRVDAASSPALFTQRITDDFLVTIRARDMVTGEDVEHGLLRVFATFSWLVREVSGAWRIETTLRREDLPRTVTVSAVAAGARIGAMACRRLSRSDAAAVIAAAVIATARAPSISRLAA